MTSGQAVLRHRPDWEDAAQNLIDGCAALGDADQRVRFLDRVCLSLGDQLYPAFLKLLCLVNDQGDLAARRVVARTMVHALSTGRMPSGRLHAWGGHTGEGRTRSLGPIEYLCAWHVQQSGQSLLPAATFDRVATSVLALVACDDEARALYCAKLREDIDDPLGGSLTRSTRAGLEALVAAWEAGATPADTVRQLMTALHGAPWGALGDARAHWTGRA